MAKQKLPPFSLSKIYVPDGVSPKFTKDEQNPATFDPSTSYYLPPIGVDPTGKPFYHLPNDGSTLDPYDRTNHARTAWRQYYDAKVAATTAGTFPVWVWVALGGAALTVGILYGTR